MGWHKAVFDRDIAAVRSLIAAGEGIEKDLGGNLTPLLYASRMGSPEIVMLLIEAGADPCKVTPGGDTAITLAQEASVSKEVKKRLIQLLRNAGVPQEPEPHQNQRSAEQIVAAPPAQRMPESVERAFGPQKTLVERINEAIQAGVYPGKFLKYAEMTNDAAALKILFDQGIGVQRVLASLQLNRSNAPLVEHFLKHGADANARDSLQRTPIFNTESPEIIELLLRAGADANLKDQALTTPIMHAPSREICQILIDAGADVNTVDYEGRTPLMLLNEKQGIDLLIEAGGKPDAQDKAGKSALIHHAINNEIGAVKALIAAKADLNIRDASGRTALRHAKQAGNFEIAKLLTEAGATRQGLVLDKFLAHWKIIVKIVLLSVIATVLIFWLISYWNRPEPEKRRVEVGGSVLTMRTEPHIKGPFVLSIPHRAEVIVIQEADRTETITGKTGKWTKVRYKGSEGWVFGGFLIKE